MPEFGHTDHDYDLAEWRPKILMFLKRFLRRNKIFFQIYET